MSTHDKDNDQNTDLPLEDAEVHNDREHDDDADMHDDPDMRADGNGSPDYLATPKRGKGVRRLNNKPLFVVGGVILLAVAGVSYTFFQRQAAQVAPKAEGDGPPVATVAAPPVRPDGNDYVPPAGQPQMPTDTAQPVETGGQPTEAQQKAAAPAVPSEAMQRRLRQIQQAEDKRLAKWDEALNGDASVQGFTTKGGQNGGTQQVAMQQAGGNRVNADELMNRYLAANGQAAGMGGMGGGMPGMGGGGMGGNSMAAENQQDRKQAFLAGTPEAEVYLARQRKAAIAPSQEIKAGWVIPGVMISGINSDLPGQIIGQVREAVYDSATGTQCLIPPGSRVVGTYDSGVTLGQQRALAVWRRIIYPDGSSISIDNMPGADMGGYAGFNDKVNNHYLRIFGSGLLLSVFSAGIQLSQPQASNGENYSSSQIIAGSLGQQMGQIGMQMAQRNMNIQPTLEIRPGYEFNIMVTKDIILPTWEGHPMAGSTGKGCN
ncbi:conjugal transfer protein TrbI [Morganella morganii subsp. morganii]|uniref:Conjugal transfer protein TrbI n=3 Tax=Gammaproteobacteria TaxID=1236 RepID=A0A6W0IXM4_SALER|nr:MULTISPECIES: TrbI/VirB10 family protein [Pseudomonadota]EAZ7956795.1 conjugal transfer protein TrbI [Salmonella enterica]ECA4269245.1 conjugal transfer protein TrbI [Salmonella enterica subsp. enterica serovar Java]ECI3874903.1 conjugal transfer protein TrbI [Salmonella enterica subsp. enterica]HBP6267190.1 conjugal transfer protein TrbI [Pseudomonas aeruginosa]HBQ6786255.1 conjugal transfer protein TrbI [Klebsiella pneumoniae]